MHFSFVPLIAGFLGVVGCLGSMLLPRALGLAHVDVVRASGEFFTKRYETALVPGLILHLVRGIVLAYVYYGICTFVPLPMNALTGLFYGLVLGAVMMLFVGIAVVEHHPDPRFQRRGVMTGVVQIIGNGIFGLIVGWMCGAWTPLH